MKKHILFFIESLSGGGAEKVLVTLLKYLDYSQYDVTLMPLVDTGILREDIDKSKIHYVPVISEAKNTRQRIWSKIKYKLIYHYLPSKLANRWIIPQKGVDVYIAFTEGFATKLLSYTPNKKIAWVHADLKTDPWTSNSKIYKSLKEEKKAYNRYDNVVCVSQSVEHIMREHYGLHQTTTIYNPIDTENILLKASQPINIDLPSAFNIVSVGRLVPQKGYDRLIPIIGKLRREGKNIQLFLIGEGVERKNLEIIIEKEGLQDVVHLMGFQKNPYALMSKMDLFVCSSKAEGYSLVIAEAMILGLPVVSTNCAGPNELLDHGKYGLLVDNNHTSIHLAICNIINDTALQEKLREKSLERSKSFGCANAIYALEFLINENS